MQKTITQARAENDAYHELDGTSASQVKKFKDDALEWWHVHIKGDWPKPSPTKAMVFGEHVHLMCELGGPQHVTAYAPEGQEVFSPERIEELPRMVEEPEADPNRRMKAYQNWKKSQAEGAVIVPKGTTESIRQYTKWQQQHEGKLILAEGEPNPYQWVWNHLVLNSETAAWLECEEKEKEFQWMDPKTGLHLRCKIDVLDSEERYFVDWKTCQNPLAHKFSYDAQQMRYHIQLAFYRRAVRQFVEAGGAYRAAVGAIESSGSYRVRPYVIDDAWIDKGDELLDVYLAQMKAFDIADEEDADLQLLAEPRQDYREKFETE